MVDMRTDGGMNPPPTESNEESKSQQFTAVNNGTGNGTSSVNRRPQLPPLGPGQNPRDTNTTSVSTSSPRYPLAGDEHWRRVETVEVTGSPQKRKRSPDRQMPRAMTPTTQITQHHLAAHEAALNVEEHSGSARHLHRQLAGVGAEDDNAHDGSYGMDEDYKTHDGDRTRTGTLEGSPQPGASQGPNKRKRVFSNRTKTGCITCRRRKKKCDEGKPECSNCRRGGFVCEGYSGKINWQKPPGKSISTVGTPVNIQSRTEQQPASASASASPSPAAVQKPHPHQVDETPQQQQQQQHQSTRSIPSPYQFVRTPIVIEEKQTAEGESVSPNSVDRKPMSHPFLGGGAGQPPQPPALPAFTSVVPPPVPSQHRRTSVSQPAALPRERSEKEKMLSSDFYNARAPELVAERDRCKAACWRFNNAAANPDLGVSRAEQGRLLMQVLRPGTSWEVAPATAQAQSRGSGTLATYVNGAGYPNDIVDVQIDAPFNCSYGYNIRLGKDVYIEAGCTILDSCSVKIKARTILSPGVSIYSATHPIDPRKRNGAKGPESAKPVLIEEDCWLGGNVIVLGGISIGKGSVVGAGSVVTKDVPPYTVVAGNPARVIRGIYRNDSTDM